jgi:eukaryotic-like serine/threonine-protein kinase
MQKLGKYELLKKLGEGSSSTVYLARDPFAGREVAIKVGTPEVLRDPENGRLYTHLFLNEASLAGQLAHPHIAQIYDAVVAENQCYIVMEYIAGGTLEPYTRPGQLLAVDRVLELIFKCTRALEFAFRQGVTHRDIKPANLLLAGPGDIKISDFGAALIRGRSDRTQVSNIGSPAYMSPEQVEDRPLDHRTDIYSLGVVMFQLLTGELPFQASSNYGMVYQITHTEPARPSFLRPALPPVLDEIVARAMAKDLASRYPDWPSFSQDLLRAVRSHPPEASAHELAETEKFSTLRAMLFFAGFSDVELWEVLRFAEWQHLTAGSLVMRAGEPGDFFCFLADGELSVGQRGKELNRLQSGACFGEMAVVSLQRPQRSVDVRTVRESRIVCIRAEALEKASTACRMHFYQGFLEVLSQRLGQANRQLLG